MIYITFQLIIYKFVYLIALQKMRISSQSYEKVTFKIKIMNEISYLIILIELMENECMFAMLVCLTK